MTEPTLLNEVVEYARSHLGELCPPGRVGPAERKEAAEAAMKALRQRGAWGRKLLSEARCHRRYTEAMRRASPRTLPQFVVELVVIILEADDSATRLVRAE